MTPEKQHELLMLFSIVLLFVLSMILAAEIDALKQQAVDRGFAEWKVIGENETEFAWKENIKTQTP